MTFITCKSKVHDSNSMSLGETSWKYSTIRVLYYMWSEMKVDCDKLKMCMYTVNPSILSQLEFPVSTSEYSYLSDYCPSSPKDEMRTLPS